MIGKPALPGGVVPNGYDPPAPVCGLDVLSAAGPMPASGPKAPLRYNRAMATPDRPIRVAVIAFDGITPFHLSVPCLVFEAGRDDGQAGFDVRVCAADGTPLRTSAGFAIATDFDLRALDEADIVVMPSWHNDCRAAPPALLEALRAAHVRGARVVGLCLGAFPLAEAGLLDGKTATTHWQFAAALAARHPLVDVDPDVLYVCLLYTSPSPRDRQKSRMPSSA